MAACLIGEMTESNLSMTKWYNIGVMSIYSILSRKYSMWLMKYNDLNDSSILVCNVYWEIWLFW